MTPLSGVIVVNYGSHVLIERNIPLDLPPSMIVVIVDNFSGRDERTKIEALCASRGWSLDRQDNIGFGAGVNRGVALAATMGCDRYLIVNPDLAADTATLELLALRAGDDRRTMHGPTILRPDGSIWFSGGAVRVKSGSTTTKPGTDASEPGGWLTGACLALHHELWSDVSGFDDDYFLYWEDVDLSWRVAAAGGRLKVWPDLMAIHDVGGTQVGTGKSPTYVFYNCRNRLVFARKHLSARNQLRWLIRTPTYARNVTLRGGREAFRDNPASLTWAAVRGSFRGVASVIRGLASRHSGSALS